MNIVEMILPKKRGRPAIPSGPEKAPPIASRIETVETELAALHGQQGRAAVAWSLNHDGAADHLAGIEQRIGELDRDLARLRLAHEEAERQDRAMFAAQRAALQSSQIAACRRHLRNRDDAAMRLSVAVKNAVSAYREMILSARKAQRACPIGMQWPPGSLTGDGELQHLVDRELFRVGGRNEGDPDKMPSFPRNREFLLEHPSQQPPIAERLRRQSEITLAALTGKPLPAEPAPVSPEPVAVMSATLPLAGAVHADPEAQAEFEAEKARLRQPAPAPAVDPVAMEPTAGEASAGDPVAMEPTAGEASAEAGY